MCYICNIAVVTGDDGAERKKTFGSMKILDYSNVPGLLTPRLLSCKKIKPFIYINLYSRAFCNPLKNKNKTKQKLS